MNGIRELLLPNTWTADTAERARARAAKPVADVERLAAWVAARSEGERNRGLFWAACRLAEAGAPAAEILAALGPSASRAGLADAEIASTLRSAVRTVERAPERGPAGDFPARHRLGRAGTALTDRLTPR